MMPTDWIVVEARVSGCSAAVYFNDIPVGDVGREQALSVAVPVNQFAFGGGNTLAMLVNPGPTPSAARAPHPEPWSARGATAQASVARYRPGAVSGDGSGQQLGSVSWSARDDDEPEAFPQTVQSAIPVEMDLGPWIWQSADALTLDGPTLEEVGAVTEIVRSGLEVGDASSFLDLATRGLREIARAYGDSPDAGVDTLRAVIDHSRGAPHWRFPPLPREAWDPRLVADGRMVEMVGRDFDPIVRSAVDDEDNSFSMPMMLGRVDGQWAILR